MDIGGQESFVHLGLNCALKMSITYRCINTLWVLDNADTKKMEEQVWRMDVGSWTSFVHLRWNCGFILNITCA